MGQELQDEAIRSKRVPPQHQPHSRSQLPHTGLPMSPQNPPSALQRSSTPTLIHSPVHPSHPSALSHSSNNLSLTSSPPTSPTPSISGANRLNVGSRTSVPRAAPTVKKANATEDSLENLTKSTPPPSTPDVPSTQSLVPWNRPKSRLAEQEQNDKLKAEAANKVKKEKEEAEAERKAKLEEAAQLEERRRKEEEERFRKEAEALERRRLKEEEERRLKAKEEEKALRLAQEQKEKMEKAEAEHKAKLEDAVRLKEQRRQEEEERLRKEAEALERQRLEEERRKKAKKEEEEKALRLAQEQKEKGKAEAERKAKLDEAARLEERRRKEEEERLQRQAERQRLKEKEKALQLAQESRLRKEAEHFSFSKAKYEDVARLEKQKEEEILRKQAEALERQRLKEEEWRKQEEERILTAKEKSLRLAQGAKEGRSSGAVPPSPQASVGLGFTQSALGKSGANNLFSTGTMGAGSKLSSEGRYSPMPQNQPPPHHPHPGSQPHAGLPMSPRNPPSALQSTPTPSTPAVSSPQSLVVDHDSPLGGSHDRGKFNLPQVEPDGWAVTGRGYGPRPPRPPKAGDLSTFGIPKKIGKAQSQTHSEEGSIKMIKEAALTESESSHSEDEASIEMTEDAALKKISEDLKEFFAVRNLKEAEVYFSSLPPQYHHFLVKELVWTATEDDVKLVSRFFSLAASKGLCSAASFEEGLTPLAEVIIDIASEVPKASQLLAMMAKGASLNRKRLSNLASKSLDSGKFLALLR